MERLRIVSAGRGSTTRILTEAGEDISRYVTGIKIEINPGGLVIAEITMVAIGLDLLADLRNVNVPEPSEKDTETV